MDRWYFGKEEYEKYHDLVRDRLSGTTVSKSVIPAKDPGGLIYEADRLGIEDFYELLGCLEGMCYNGEAKEIDDSTYFIY